MHFTWRLTWCRRMVFPMRGRGWIGTGCHSLTRSALFSLINSSRSWHRKREGLVYVPVGIESYNSGENALSRIIGHVIIRGSDYINFIHSGASHSSRRRRLRLATACCDRSWWREDPSERGDNNKEANAIHRKELGEERMKSFLIGLVGLVRLQGCLNWKLICWRLEGCGALPWTWVVRDMGRNSDIKRLFEVILNFIFQI